MVLLVLLVGFFGVAASVDVKTWLGLGGTGIEGSHVRPEDGAPRPTVSVASLGSDKQVRDALIALGTTVLKHQQDIRDLKATRCCNKTEQYVTNGQQKDQTYVYKTVNSLKKDLELSQRLGKQQQILIQTLNTKIRQQENNVQSLTSRVMSLLAEVRNGTKEQQRMSAKSDAKQAALEDKVFNLETTIAELLNTKSATPHTAPATVPVTYSAIETTMRTPCPDGFVSRWQSSCYLFSKGEDKTWDGARQHCKNAGGDLASVESKAEDQFIVSQLKGIYGLGGTHWTAGKQVDGVWRWVNTGQNVTSFTKWNKHYYTGGAGLSKCMFYQFLGGAWNWDDYDCIYSHESAYAICEA